MQEEAGARLGAAKGAIAGKDHKNKVKKIESSTRKKSTVCGERQVRMKKWTTMFCVFLLTPMCLLVFLCLGFLLPTFS